MAQQFLALFKYDVPRLNPRTGRVNKWVPKEDGGSVSIFTDSFHSAYVEAKCHKPAGAHLEAIDYWPHGKNQLRVRIKV